MINFQALHNLSEETAQARDNAMFHHFVPTTLFQALNEQIDLAQYISFIGPVNIVICIGQCDYTSGGDAASEGFDLPTNQGKHSCFRCIA